MTIDSLALLSDDRPDRAISFTNHRSAFYYTQARVNDHPEHAWFQGFNLAGRRVFAGYRITVDGRALDPAHAESVTVGPDVLVRRYAGGIEESLRLYDDLDVVGVEVRGAGGPTGFELVGPYVHAIDGTGDRPSYRVDPESPGQPDLFIATVRTGDGFLACVGPALAAASDLCAATARDEPRLRAERRARLERVVSGPGHVETSDPELTRALRWIMLTTDQLLTRQRGDGIYAGLPWFAEYWGRDSFISLTGATLVTGQFEAARAILTSFAAFQDLNRDSPFYGRVPNIVKPGSLDYHTTDGTPRFVIALRDYVRYTGDLTLLRELYRNVEASIEGSLARFTDKDGLLVHADNETWMDARRAEDLVAYAPRGDRANDIQALWYAQLQAGAEFAAVLGRTEDARRWNFAAERVRAAFDRAFVRRDGGKVTVADHVTATGVADITVRPNLLFALDLLPADEAAQVTAHAWQTLVFPWGVATLDPADANFHPYHYAPDCWHKDAAYHNGTVWPWLDGIFIDRMIDFGQVEPAWQLFRARDRLALERGVVGGLPETLDAYPHAGEAAPRLTGTYLQAWSNAEHLRAWYQDFLGIRPALDRGRVELRPRLPASLTSVEFAARIGSGQLRARYEQPSPEVRRYAWTAQGFSTQVAVDLPGQEVRDFDLPDGGTLVVEQQPDGADTWIIGSDGQRRSAARLKPSPAHVEEQRHWNAIFAGRDFAAPKPVTNPALRCVPKAR